MKKNKNELSLDFKIERSNEFNKMYPKGLNLTEVRFLAIYQARINARNPETKKVTFPLSEFCRVMEIKELNVSHIKNIADKIICKPVHIPDGEGGVHVVPLFNDCHIRIDKNSGEWYVDIVCHDRCLPYMFQMKKNYFTYELWNALKLKSVNQLRMYEILKQYEKIGERTIELNELKYMLGINQNKYAEYKIFSRDVLKVCQEALEQYTDIKYTFEPIRRGRKIYALKFTITKNKNFKDDLKLKEFIKPEDLEDIKDIPDIPIGVETVENTVESYRNIPLEDLYYRCDKAYTVDELEMLIDYIENSEIKLNISVEKYIYSVYANIKIKGNKVNNLFRYTFSVIEKQVNDYIFAPNKPKEDEKSQKQEVKQKKKRETSYDLDEFKLFLDYNLANIVNKD